MLLQLSENRQSLLKPNVRLIYLWVKKNKTINQSKTDEVIDLEIKYRVELETFLKSDKKGP